MAPRFTDDLREEEMRKAALQSWRELAVIDRSQGIRIWWPADAFSLVPKDGALAHHEIVGAYCDAYNEG